MELVSFLTRKGRSDQTVLLRHDYLLWFVSCGVNRRANELQAV